jgi:hypothetical protein
MTYTFTLYVVDYESENRIYAEYHNFREYGAGYIYYRGGATHPIEIAVSKANAIASMNGLIAAGWTCDNPKIVEIYF